MTKNNGSSSARKVDTKRVDLAIIGGGGAAFAAAAKANELGVSAILINSGLPMGGTCVNVGCVPSKFLLEVGFDIFRSRHPRFKSVPSASSEFSFSSIIAEKREVVLRNRSLKYTEVLNHYETVEFLEARAHFEGPGRIRAADQLIEAKYTLIATGSSGRPLELPGMETLAREDVLNNVDAFELERLPDSMIVVGGGPTGLEVAQMFQHFGTKVSLVQKNKRLFTQTEPEISDVIASNLLQDGIDVRAGAMPLKVRKESGKVVLMLQVDDGVEELRAEKLFVAIGVRGNTHDLNLSSIGLTASSKGYIEVDAEMRTSVPGVFAAGDVTGPPLLETVAARQGSTAVASAFDAKPVKTNYDAIPAAVFIEPQVAMVGLTEAELMSRIGVCSCRTVPLRFVPKADITNQTNGVAKMVVDPRSNKIVGFHLVSPHAAEIVHEAALAIQHGLTIHDVIDLVHVFPSYSEVLKLTAQAFVRDIKQMSCCVE